MNKVCTRDEVIDVLRTIKDPELSIDVWTLGLIYDISCKEDGITLLMTLTSPLCPFADDLIEEVESALAPLVGGDDTAVSVELTFDPPWEPSADLRMELGL